MSSRKFYVAIRTFAGTNPSVIQRKVTNGYRAKWAADAEAALRSTVDTSRLAGNQPFHTILRAISA